MKYISGEDGFAVLELSRRNLTILLAKLDDPLSVRALVTPDGQLRVRAVEGIGCAESRYAQLNEGVLQLTRREIRCLLKVLDLGHGAQMPKRIGNVSIRAVEDNEHYRDRPPGQMWMPSSKEVL